MERNNNIILVKDLKPFKESHEILPGKIGMTRLNMLKIHKKTSFNR